MGKINNAVQQKNVQSDRKARRFRVIRNSFTYETHEMENWLAIKRVFRLKSHFSGSKAGIGPMSEEDESG